MSEIGEHNNIKESIPQPYLDAGKCPDKHNHTPHPNGYLQFFTWCEKMSDTHRQTQCPTCGTWSVWEPKEESE